MKWIVLLFVPFSMAYRFIIVPGLGGSVLYNDKSQKIWPPEIGFQPQELSIGNERFSKEKPSSVGKIGDVNSIKIDTRSTYLMTKNTYYTNLINELSSNKNTVNAFPYDFRFIQHKDYYEELFNNYKVFIENEYRAKNEKFVFVAHSMGGILIHHFLQFYADQKWVSKYISKVYYINVPFGGCPIALFFLIESIGMLTSRNRDQLLFNNHILWLMLNIQNIHLFGGLYLCLPITKDPLARINNQWVYSHQIEGIFTDDWCAQSYKMAQPFFNKRHNTIDLPQVVIYSTGKNTTIFTDYDAQFSMRGDGDGLVPVESLLYPKCWKKQPDFVWIPNQDHSGINNYPPMLKMIAECRSSLEEEKPSIRRKFLGIFL